MQEQKLNKFPFDYQEPMLAVDIELDNLFSHRPLTPRPAYLAQPKINGIRAVWHPGHNRLYSRRGTQITSLPHIVYELNRCNLNQLALDGELYSDELTFQDLNGCVRKKKNHENHFLSRLVRDKILTVNFYIFDFIHPHWNTQRRNDVLDRFKETEHLLTVPSVPIRDIETAEETYKYFLEQGFEGIIFRNIKSKYMEGKSKGLYRHKPFFDLEARLVGFERSDNGIHKDTFKSLILQLPNGQKFRCSGLTELERIKLWEEQPIGATINVKYGSLTSRGVPNDPRFRAVRGD